MRAGLWITVVVAAVAIAPAARAAEPCTTSSAVTVRAPKDVRSATVFVDGKRRGTVRRGASRRVAHGGQPGATVTIRVVGRTRTGRRAVRVRRVRICAVPQRVAGPIDPAHPLLRYEGRWDIRPGRATTVTSGARVFLRFTGTAVSARFDTEGIIEPPHVYAYVDGRKSERIVVDRRSIRLTPVGLAPGEHTLELAVKDISERQNRWTPPFESALQLDGFDVPGGTLLHEPPRVPGRSFTFLGDSITQGVNVLCPTTGSDCADSTLDYARRVADAFGAALEQVGYGGQGVTGGGGGGVPKAADALGFNFDASPAAPVDSQLVVINQTTNDVITQFEQGGGPADPANEQETRAAYLEYLRHVRARYPNAFIVALEPFGLFGEYTAYAGSAIEGAVADFGDPRTRYVSTRGWLAPDDFTDSLHPSDGGHQKATARLIEVIGSLPGFAP